MERDKIKVVFIAQWVCGFYTPEQLVALLFQTNPPMHTNDIQRFLQGSHGCLKHSDVSCEGIFCMRWEAVKENADCRSCQQSAREAETEYDIEYICVPGKTISCLKHGGKPTNDTVKQEFIQPVESMQMALNDCPYPYCTFRVINATTTCEILAKPRTNAFIRHINAEHNGTIV